MTLLSTYLKGADTYMDLMHLWNPKRSDTTVCACAHVCVSERKQEKTKFIWALTGKLI